MVERRTIVIGDTSQSRISERIAVMSLRTLDQRRPHPALSRRSILALLFAFFAVVATVGSGTPVSADERDGAPLTELPAAVPDGIRDSIVRLYGAVFDRTPDAAGFSFWLDQYLTGTPLATVAEAFMQSPEWTTTYGEVDDDAFVELLYRNVLGRAPDPDGAAHWRSQLEGGMSRVTMLLGFSESDEYVAATGTAPPEAPRVFPALPPDSGNGRRIVYSNSEQRVWWVDATERVVESYAVSGRRGVPNPGTYQVFSKSPLAWAGHDGITMKHMVRFAHGQSLAIGFHAIPRFPDGSPLQTEAELGGYRSAGCVRQADHNAEALYNWAEVGTTVVVLG